MSRLFRYSWLLACCIIVALCTYALTFPINHDVGWWLYIARRMLAGETLYRDLLEVNPPLMAYLAMFPVELSRVLSIELATVTSFLTLGISLASVCWGASLLTDQTPRNSFLATCLLLAVPLLGITGGDWAQREHLMVILTMPLICLLGVTPDHRPSEMQAILAGITAGVGFSLKPQFAVILLVLVLLTGVRSRSLNSFARRREVIVASLIFATYYALVPAIWPEYIELLRGTHQLYSNFSSRSTAAMILRPVTALFVSSVFLAFWLRRMNRLPGVLAPFLAVGGAGWVGAVLQRKGWSYHFLPATVFLLIAAIIILGAMLQARMSLAAVRDRLAFAVGVFALLASIFTTSLSTVIQELWERDQRHAFVREHREWLEAAGARSLTMLSSRVPDAFPLVVESDLRWDSPFPSLWWVRASHGAHVDTPVAGADVIEPTSEIERQFRQKLISTMLLKKPDAILVDSNPLGQFDGTRFPYVQYLGQVETFRDFMQSYSITDTVGVFVVYQRRQALGEGQTAE